MSILDDISKSLLVESMRRRMCGILKESSTLTSKQATDKSKFISESASYEQLLNITLNPLRESKYLPAYVLEGAVAIIHRACLTGRKVIGINALTEGALKLKKETGAVITESMLDAAQVAVHDGIGLQIVGDVLKESILMEDVLDAVYGTNKPDLIKIQGSLKRGDSGALDRAYQFIDREFGSNIAKAERYKNLIKDNPAEFQKIMGAHAVRKAAKDPRLTFASGDAFRKTVRNKGLDYFKNFGRNIPSSPAVPPGIPPLPPNVSQRTHDIVAGASKGGMGLLPKIALGVGGTAAALWAWNKYNQNKRDMEG